MAINKVFDVDQFLSPDQLAIHVVDLWNKWEASRVEWTKGRTELSEYLFATDTTHTSNRKNNWQNTTVTPKLCQIRDNLHANYMAALFPNDYWLKWYGNDEDSVSIEKAKAIEAFMRNKLNQIGFESKIAKLVYDYIDNGNVFAGVTFVRDVGEDADGLPITRYVGPDIFRISPHDHMFDIAAPTYKSAPKVTRYMKSIGDIEKDIANQPELGYLQEVVDDIKNKRVQYAVRLQHDSFQEKNNALIASGFHSLNDYYNLGWVEILEFEGDIYDQDKGILLQNQVITVVDRSRVLRNEPIKSWLGNNYKHHAGWRDRPDNLMSMGPLDNLVGMQYRIDHLENLKADVFDFIAFPLQKIKGNVDDYEHVPGERIYLGDDGDVTYLHPDVTALNADTQISILEQKMEEMAGAPKQAMGFRTAGEKTAYEVQVLENGASRIFEAKINHFSKVFLEPTINQMFEIARRNMESSEEVQVVDEDTGAVMFMTITKEDIQATGNLRPQGARHYSQQAQLMQNLNNFYNSAMGQDPAVMTHVSGKKLAELVIDDVFKLESKGIVQDNVRVMEAAETARLSSAAQEELEVEQATPVPQ